MSFTDKLSLLLNNRILLLGITIFLTLTKDQPVGFGNIPTEDLQVRRHRYLNFRSSLDRHPKMRRIQMRMEKREEESSPQESILVQFPRDRRHLLLHRRHHRPARHLVVLLWSTLLVFSGLLI